MNAYAVLHKIADGCSPTLVGVFRSKSAATRCRNAFAAGVNGIVSAVNMANEQSNNEDALVRARARVEHNCWGER